MKKSKLRDEDFSTYNSVQETHHNIIDREIEILQENAQKEINAIEKEIAKQNKVVKKARDKVKRIQANVDKAKITTKKMQSEAYYEKATKLREDLGVSKLEKDAAVSHLGLLKDQLKLYKASLKDYKLLERRWKNEGYPKGITIPKDMALNHTQGRPKHDIPMVVVDFVPEMDEWN